MGHVYEKILADTLVRWFRLHGDDVRFHIGTDENGIKIQQTAKRMGITPRELVDRNAPKFEDLFRRIGISFDYFIRTADAQSHWPTVTVLWQRLREAGCLEKRTYTGLYCPGCERFVTGKDLVGGFCPDHGIPPQEVTEENWFFLLKKKQNDVQKLLDAKTGTYAIVPSWRAKETLTFLEGGLEDVSFSRSKAALSWGVPVPGDPEQVMYVWCDNLTSYISSLGLLTGHAMSEWWDDAEVTHVIGKDIARFHAINWPAMLQVAGLRTPDRLLIHGFITSEGQKMSKSIGNVVDPVEVIEKYGVDALRFYLMHEIPVGNDGDFSWKRFGEIYQSKLGNQLGNLLNRVLVLLRKTGGTLHISSDDLVGMEGIWKLYGEAMSSFTLHLALQLQVVGLLVFGNGYMDRMKPWALHNEKAGGELSDLAELLRHISLMLLPFIPETAQKMSVQLGVPYAERMLGRGFVITEEMKQWGGCKDWKRAGEPKILFPKVD